MMVFKLVNRGWSNMYNSEADLVLRYLENERGKGNKVIITEMETNFGRPDIVILYYNDKLLKSRQNTVYKQKFLREYSYLMAYLFKKRWVSKKKIMSFFSFTEKQLNKFINELLEMELIEVKGSNIKTKPANELLVIKRIKVIEAKLSDWKYVIEQAERHLWFSRESYILLPNISQYIIEQTSSNCLKLGLGLLTVDTNKNLELVKPQSSAVINTPLLWELNEKLVKGELTFE